MKKLRRIVLYGHPALRTPVAPATVGAKETLKIANALRARLSTIEGYGLAANQLGFDAQIFTYREGGKGKFKTILNPTIEEYDDEMFMFHEGCLSIPNYWWDLERPRRVLLTGVDLRGEEVQIEAEDTLARIFQHEIDHFNGKLVIDRLDREALAEFKLKWYAQHHYLEKEDEDELQDQAE